VVLEALCRWWGFYFVTSRDKSGLGSRDMDVLIQGLDHDEVYSSAIAHMEQPSHYQWAIDYMRDATHRRLAQILLARFLLLDLLVQEARQTPGGLQDKEHRQLWVYLQVYPGLFDRSRTMLLEDLFADLAELLMNVSLQELTKKAKELRRKLGDLLPKVRSGNRAPFFSVLDEAQAAILLRHGQYIYATRKTPCGFLREWIRFHTDVFSHEVMRLVLAGTGMDAEVLRDTVTSPALKDEPFEWTNDIGAFDNSESQVCYIKRYIPAPWTTPQWRHFLERAWNWLRGRWAIQVFSM
jgi:hypothetical protein